MLLIINGHDDRSDSAVPDVAFAMAVGLLAFGARSYYAAALALTGRTANADALFGTAGASRMVVWAICAAPPVLYFTFMAAQCATGGGPGPGALSRRLHDAWHQRVTPAGDDGFAFFISHGVKGGISAVLVLAPLFGVFLLLCAVMMFFGPGPAIILLPVIAAVVGLLAAAGWGAAVGALLYVRRTWGWLAGIAAAAILVLLVNWLVEHWLII